MMNVLIRTNHARRAVLIACISLSNMAEIAIVAIHMADIVAVDGKIWFSK